MIVERVYRQRCLPQVVGGDAVEDVIVYRHRRPDPDKPPAAQKPKPRVAKPHGCDRRQQRFWWGEVDLEEPKAAPPVTRPRKRSLHPAKLTLAEKATFQVLPAGWDADRPICRGDCVGDQPCPWCGKPVAMRISYATAPGTIHCPECQGYVAYRRARAGQPWGWQRFNPRHPMLGTPDLLPMQARNKCRPCWMVRCCMHLYIDVKGECGSMKLNHPHVPPDRMDLLADTCAQDVADRVDFEGVGTEPKVLPLVIVGAKLGLTLERARQLEAQALQEVRVREIRDNSR